MANLKVVTTVGGQEVITIVDYTPANEITLNNLTATSPINLDTDVFLVDGSRDIEGVLTVTEAITDATININQTGATGNNWSIENNASKGLFAVRNVTSAIKPFKIFKESSANLMQLGKADADTVKITGTLDVTTAIQLNANQLHPDYVFEDNYNLKTIKQYSAEMWKNKHLPSMISAEQVSKNGYDIDSFNRGILEGLEYAHIYIDQLNKRITELESHL